MTFRAPLIGLAILIAAAPARATVNPAAERKAISVRMADIRRQVENLDVKLRAAGLSQAAFGALQELRTSLEQERRLLEERERVLERVEKSGAIAVSSAAAPGAADPAKTLWEKGGWARFEGLLPCAGCEAVKTEITFYNDGLKYLMEESYVGAGSPKRVFTTEGLWTTLRGHGDNPDATVFQLDYDRPGHERHFLRVTDDEIKLLDLDESKLKKKPNLLLKRVAP